VSGLVGVSRSCYYSFEKSDARTPDPELEEMLDWVRRIDTSSKGTYGSRRMKRALNALSYPVSREKARRLMRLAGVWVRQRKKYKVTTNSKHSLPIYENLVDRQFDVARPNEVYVGDITYIWTQEGWLYLAVVLDLFSRKVVGWSMSSRMKSGIKIAPAKPEVFNVSRSKRLLGRCAAPRLATNVARLYYFNRSN